jgi:SHS2 domain-containing protein
MNKQKDAGFRELEHTADVELHVWGPDLPGMLEQAARGMYSLAGIKLKPEPVRTHHFELQVTDPENLLVNFLSELLYLIEIEDVGFDSFNIRVDGDTLHAELKGSPLESQDKYIKAVTYHDLKVHHNPDGFEANIVFDV